MMTIIFIVDGLWLCLLVSLWMWFYFVMSVLVFVGFVVGRNGSYLLVCVVMCFVVIVLVLLSIMGILVVGLGSM